MYKYTCSYFCKFCIFNDYGHIYSNSCRKDYEAINVRKISCRRCMIVKFDLHWIRKKKISGDCLACLCWIRIDFSDIFLCIWIHVYCSCKMPFCNSIQWHVVKIFKLQNKMLKLSCIYSQTNKEKILDTYMHVLTEMYISCWIIVSSDPYLHILMMIYPKFKLYIFFLKSVILCIILQTFSSTCL